MVWKDFKRMMEEGLGMKQEDEVKWRELVALRKLANMSESEKKSTLACYIKPTNVSIRVHELIGEQ